MYFMIDRVLVVVVGVLLLIAGITDIRKRQISRRLLMLLTLVCIVAVLVRGSFAVMDAAGGMAIGLCVIGISMISREQIGRGDGIVIAVIGLVLGFRRCLAVVSVASLVMCAAAIVVLLFKRGTGVRSLRFCRRSLWDMYCAVREADGKVAVCVKKWEAAYFTVEASLILPVTMLFTVMMIFLAFYSYDRCILEHSAYEAALRGTGSHIRTAEAAGEQARIAAGRLVDGKLIAIGDVLYDIEVDADKVTVAYHCVVNMPFVTWLGEYALGTDMTLDISRSAMRHRPVRMIRECRTFNKYLTLKTE